MKKLTKKDLIDSLMNCKNDDLALVISDDGVSEKFITDVKETSNKIKLIAKW
jgi:hypothetical protein